MMGLAGVQGFNLQATLSANTAGAESVPDGPHHPITCCTGQLYYFDDGTFACDHAKVAPCDQRTKDALNLTVAILVLELAITTL